MDHCLGFINDLLLNLSDVGLVLILLSGVGIFVMALYGELKLDNPIVQLFILCVSLPLFIIWADGVRQFLLPEFCFKGAGGEMEASVFILLPSAISLIFYLWFIHMVYF
jgi:hypothetical protein